MQRTLISAKPSVKKEDTDATDVNKEVSPKSDKSKITFLLRGLKYEPKTKEEYTKVVKEITQLDLEEKNYSEIVSRLEVLIKEKNEYDNEKI